VEPTNNRFQVLSLSGGGYRGLYTAAVLAAIENHSKQPVGSFFEIIAGTSIGGIIALAAAFEVEMAKVLQIFKDAGPSIFLRDRRAISCKTVGTWFPTFVVPSTHMSRSEKSLRTCLAKTQNLVMRSTLYSYQPLT